MEMELKIAELAKEYKENRDAFMRVHPKTKKKIKAFADWLIDFHLTKNDIVESEKRFFKFCDYCQEVLEFECREFDLCWSFETECRCARIKKAMEKDMKERIKKHREGAKYEVQRLF